MSQTFWTAVSAIATIGYLIASVFLWLTTRKAANAAKRQAELTADAIRIAAEQAATSRQQFELSKQMFLADMQPLVFFADAHIMFVGEHGESFNFTFTMRNQGKIPATNVRWRMRMIGNGDVLEDTLPTVRRELAPSEEATDAITATIFGTAGPVPSAARSAVRAYVEVQYTNPLDNSVRHSECLLESDSVSGRIHKTTFTGNPVHETNTDLCSGVPFP
ncbi:MAG: hypothetical protein LAN70_01695 [Acidobacteriia bacterium]|nr:hypothetical protein [Terriglobia bacterium]